MCIYIYIYRCIYIYIYTHTSTYIHVNICYDLVVLKKVAALMVHNKHMINKIMNCHKTSKKYIAYRQLTLFSNIYQIHKIIHISYVVVLCS